MNSKWKQIILSSEQCGNGILDEWELESGPIHIRIREYGKGRWRMNCHLTNDLYSKELCVNNSRDAKIEAQFRVLRALADLMQIAEAWPLTEPA